MVLRDRDANGGGGWLGQSDGTLEERVYYCQNWRADVSAILNASGKLVEWIKYSAYGTPIALPAGDTDSDGDWDATDSGAITTAIFLGSPYNVRNDANLDGSVTSADITHANSITGTYQTLGRGVLSSVAVANRKAYAGYENDGAAVRFYHVRHRVLDTTLGRWTRRDPFGEFDGPNLMQYTGSSPVLYVDPTGEHRTPCGATGCQPEIPVPPSGPGTNPGVQPPTMPPGLCGVPDPGIGDCCDLIEASCRDGDAGGVVCCRGQIVSCVWQRHPGTPGHNIILDCIRVHEDARHGDVDCTECPMGMICRARFRPGVSPKRGECTAYRAEWRCLIARLSDCCLLPEPDRSTCVREVRDEMSFIQKQLWQFCGDFIPGVPARPCK